MKNQIELSIGDRVWAKDAGLGTVIGPGPYGDFPFQVLADGGTCYPFVGNDGTCDFNSRDWMIVEKAENVGR